MMICAIETKVIPVLPTRKEVCEILDLKMEQVKRLDYERLIIRHPGFGKPLRYVGTSIRDFAEGKVPSKAR